MASEPPKTPPQLSPDGRYWWDGEIWIPVDDGPEVPTAPPPAPGVTGRRLGLRAVLAGSLIALLVIAAVVAGLVIHGRGGTGLQALTSPSVRPTLRASSPAPSTAPSPSPTAAPTPHAGGTYFDKLYDNVGISNAKHPQAANLDGSGDSYSVAALRSAGVRPEEVLSEGGVTLKWPGPVAGKPDNVLAEGQKVHLTGAGSTLGFLGVATNGDSTGTGTVLYTDGTSSTYRLTLDNWFDPSAGAGDILAARAPYINDSDPATNHGRQGRRNHAAALFYSGVAINPHKTVRAVILPDTTTVASGGAITGMHIFALAVGQ